ncbi:hypothetical protein T07_5972 [Trichinella nelsoni]|uniref:Uncharacterized protein n=1 Tax=Trichinella nelsoni TaxID=6336 RepID=A0A0V0RBG2_9BILA|nr:hypothetical protein T07_5972 [Trichinella nelsoni]
MWPSYWPSSSHTILCTTSALRPCYMFYYSFYLYWLSITFIHSPTFLAIVY